LNVKSNVAACSVVGSAEIALLASLSLGCANKTETGHGLQSHPPTRPAADDGAPQPLLARAPVPEAFVGAARAELLVA
jgi:hypothetical protein